MTDDSRITLNVDAKPALSSEDYDERDDRPRARRYGRDYRRDSEHLKMLSIFYFVFCGLNSIGLFAGVLYMAIGLAMVVGSTSGGANAPPQAIGFLLVGVGFFATILIGVIATCVGLTGYYLQKRKRRMFCFVVACCICCVSVPVGTLLGIFTILVLQRESVKEMFRTAAVTASPAAPQEDTQDEDLPVA
jgi:hypothetical protein